MDIDKLAVLEAYVERYIQWREEGLAKGYLARNADGALYKTDKAKDYDKELEKYQK